MAFSGKTLTITTGTWGFADMILNIISHLIRLVNRWAHRLTAPDKRIVIFCQICKRYHLIIGNIMIQSKHFRLRGIRA